MTAQEERFAGWAILELMGHRRLAGYVQEEVVAGSSFLRIDVPDEPGPTGQEYVATQLYSPSAVYCITPTTEEIARSFATRNRPEPVHRWELPPAAGDGLTTPARAGHFIEDGELEHVEPDF